MSGAVFGAIGTLLGMLLTLYIKDKAREVAKAELTEAVKSALVAFKSELTETLDEKYVRVGEYKLTQQFTEDQIEVLTQAIRVLEQTLFKKVN